MYVLVKFECAVKVGSGIAIIIMTYGVEIRCQGCCDTWYFVMTDNLPHTILHRVVLVEFECIVTVVVMLVIIFS